MSRNERLWDVVDAIENFIQAKIAWERDYMANPETASLEEVNKTRYELVKMLERNL